MIEDAPYVTNIETLDEYSCDFCVHGGLLLISNSLYNCHFVNSYACLLHVYQLHIQTAWLITVVRFSLCATDWSIILQSGATHVDSILCVCSGVSLLNKS